jgi:NitT/TauT family transport system permease protein
LSRVDATRFAIVAGAIALVEILCRTHVVDRLTLIPPSEMAASLVHLLTVPAIQNDLLFTLVNTALAIAIAVVLGFVAGALLHALPRLRRVVDPLLAAYYAVPTFVFYPLLVALLGLNRLPLIAIGTILGVVAMTVNTIAGLDRVPRVYQKTAATYRMGRVATALLVHLPAATPYLATGIKLAVSYSIVGTIAGEFILSVAGLGRAMALAYNNLDNRAMYGLLLLLLVVVTIVNVSIYEWERAVHRRWGLR